MLVDRDYIFTLYQMGASAIFRYFRQLEQRIEDAEARAARSHDVRAVLLAKELSSTKRTLATKSRQLLAERPLNHQLRCRIRELEHEIERGTGAVERDSHNSSLPPSLDPPWQVGADETGLRVAGGNAWVHVARTERLTHFAYDERRGKAAMDEVGILPQFKGTLVRDGYLSYTRFERRRHGLCNAHLLRELVFIEETSPEQKVWTTPLSKLLLKIKETADKARAQQAARLDQSEQSAYLRRYDRLVRKAVKLNPLIPRRKRQPGAMKKKRVAQPTANGIVQRLQRRRDEILRFMTDLSVPFDNNGSERDLRMIKLQQKTSGCFRTEDGARVFCRVRSYLSTARKQGHSLLHALERVLAGKPLSFQPTELASSS